MWSLWVNMFEKKELNRRKRVGSPHPIERLQTTSKFVMARHHCQPFI
jgi:hypothetical protein